MRICLILEGCYPYVTGGVSTWVHQYMQAMPQHEFVLWLVGADPSMRGQFKYTLPENVKEVKEIFLQDALKKAGSYQKYKFNKTELATLHDFINCSSPNWDVMFEMYQDKKIDPLAFLMSEDFLKILTNVCNEEYPHTAFSDLFHTIRSMFLPVLYVLRQEVPKADVYHAIATGYSGILARLGSYKYHVPYLITEHGIYTREREEEIIRAKWVLADFKKFWVKFFYMLSSGAYERATKVTSLFAGARRIQLEMGCAPDQCIVIGNGIHYEKFCDIEPRDPSGSINISAVVRLSPIKDIKTMIYAFSGLKARVPNARLSIYGPEEDEEYSRECHQLVERLCITDLDFPGRVEVEKILQTSDFTILTSISEGMPLSILESFAAAKPCVVTDVGCCKELVTKVAPDDEFGESGICVSPMDIQGLTDAMTTLCNNPERMMRMGQNGRHRVEKYFRHDDMIDRYLKLYDEVLTRWQE